MRQSYDQDYQRKRNAMAKQLLEARKLLRASTTEHGKESARILLEILRNNSVKLRYAHGYRNPMV